MGRNLRVNRQPRSDMCSGHRVRTMSSHMCTNFMSRVLEETYIRHLRKYILSRLSRHIRRIRLTPKSLLRSTASVARMLSVGHVAPCTLPHDDDPRPTRLTRIFAWFYCEFSLAADSLCLIIGRHALSVNTSESNEDWGLRHSCARVQ